MNAAMQVGAVIRWRLKEVMRARRINNRQLARLTGLHENSISRIKAGVERIDTDTLDKLCTALQCQPGDLITHEPDQGGK